VLFGAPLEPFENKQKLAFGEVKASNFRHPVAEIPPIDYDYLLKETKSCQAVFGPGTRITDAAKLVLDLIEKE